MPLPSSGPISFADLNEELGNASTSQLDMDSAAIEFNLTKPHGMDEFYGLSITTTKPPTTTTTTTSSPFISYVVTYDEFNEETACASFNQFTIFSQCNLITLPGIGQCFLYNTQNTGDPVSPGYYADVSTNNYYYVESGGLVEEIGSCTPPITTTTTLPPSIEPWGGSIQQASSIAACNASATNIYGFIGSGVVPEINDTCFTTTGGGKFLPAGFYFEGGDFASLQIGSSGLVINKVLC